MYGKIFKQMYKGTLAMVGPWEALVTFQQMIVLADIDGIVDMTSDAISRETTIPSKIINKGIEALEQPDPESRSPDEDGRRLVRLSDNRVWGWRIVNYQYYRKLRSEEERREYHRQYYRENRSKSAINKKAKKSQPDSTTAQHHSTDSTNSRGRGSKYKEEVNINPTAWGEYVCHRKEIRKKITPLSEVKQKNILAKHSFADQQMMVDASIANGWAGIFPLGKQPKNTVAPTTDDYAAELGITQGEKEANEAFKGRVRDALVARDYST